MDEHASPTVDASRSAVVGCWSSLPCRPCSGAGGPCPPVLPEPAAPVTVPAPGAGDGATVTVSRTSDLVNQTVEVSLAGFRPSSSTRLQNSGDSLDVNTEYPVRVYECRGADPASSSDCYGSPGFRGVDASDSSPGRPGRPRVHLPRPDRPVRRDSGRTGQLAGQRHPGGRHRQVTIQVFTKRESAGLGCDVDSPCAIVVVPNYGRGQAGVGDTEDVMDAPWAWDRRTVVPLTFQSVDDACPLGSPSLGVEGSPIAADLLASWRARTCTLSSHAVGLDYTAIGEPQTRADVASGVTDTGLVIDPLDADAADGSGIVYAPVSVTGLVVAFQVDDADGRPVTSMKLDRTSGRQAGHRVVPLGRGPCRQRQPLQHLPRPRVPQAQPGRRLAQRRTRQPRAAAGRPLRHHLGADAVDHERP